MKTENPYDANVVSDAASCSRRRRNLVGAVAFALSVCSFILLVALEIIDTTRRYIYSPLRKLAQRHELLGGAPFRRQIL